MSEYLAGETLKNIVVTAYFKVGSTLAKVTISWMTKDTWVEEVELSHNRDIPKAPTLSVNEFARLSADISAWRDRVTQTKDKLDGSDTLSFEETVVAKEV